MEAERLHCLRWYLFTWYTIRRKHINSSIILNILPLTTKILPKKKECHLVNSLRNTFYQSFIWHPFMGTSSVVCTGVHTSLKPLTLILEHIEIRPPASPLPCALTLAVLCLECPCHSLTPAAILTLQEFALGSSQVKRLNVSHMKFT